MVTTTHISQQTKLAPDSLGPTVTVGEILVEIMAKSRGEGFLEPIELAGPYPRGSRRFMTALIFSNSTGAIMKGLIRSWPNSSLRRRSCADGT